MVYAANKAWILMILNKSQCNYWEMKRFVLCGSKKLTLCWWMNFRIPTCVNGTLSKVWLEMCGENYLLLVMRANRFIVFVELMFQFSNLYRGQLRQTEGWCAIWIRHSAHINLCYLQWIICFLFKWVHSRIPGGRSLCLSAAWTP